MVRRALATAAVASIALAGCSTETDSAAAADRDLSAQAGEIQGQLDPFFEGCVWDVQVDDGDSVQTSCAEHEIGVVVSSGPAAVAGILDAIGGALPAGGYVTEENWAVWSPDESVVNMSWDVLGASGERVWF